MPADSLVGVLALPGVGGGEGRRGLKADGSTSPIRSDVTAAPLFRAPPANAPVDEPGTAAVRQLEL